MYSNKVLDGQTRVLRLLLELSIAVLLASILFFFGKAYYIKPIAYTKQSLAEHYAGFFSRMITNISASAVASRKNYALLDDKTYVYLNEHGWPANTDSNLSPSWLNQTAAECQQLWIAFFDNAPESVLRGGVYNKNAQYSVSLNKKSICRYQWLANQEGSYFIDYDVTSGVVITTARNN